MPCEIERDGTKRWYENDKLHRTNGPAAEWVFGKKEWYANGKRHRTDGPAVIWADGSKFWWVKGVRIDIKKIISTYGLNPDWTQWTESEKVLVTLALY